MDAATSPKRNVAQFPARCTWTIRSVRSRPVVLERCPSTARPNQGNMTWQCSLQNLEAQCSMSQTQALITTGSRTVGKRARKNLRFVSQASMFPKLLTKMAKNKAIILSSKTWGGWQRTFDCCWNSLVGSVELSLFMLASKRWKEKLRQKWFVDQ